MSEKENTEQQSEGDEMLSDLELAAEQEDQAKAGTSVGGVGKVSMHDINF